MHGPDAIFYTKLFQILNIWAFLKYAILVYLTFYLCTTSNNKPEKKYFGSNQRARYFCLTHQHISYVDYDIVFFLVYNLLSDSNFVWKACKASYMPHLYISPAFMSVRKKVNNYNVCLLQKNMWHTLYCFLWSVSVWNKLLWM